MKILLIDVFHFIKGGAETVCYNTGKMLEEKGHKVSYFSLEWDENWEGPFNKYFPKSKGTRKGPFRQFFNLINYFYHFEAGRKIEKLIIDEKPDIAHIHLIWGQITPSILPVLKKYNIPVVFTTHDFRIVCPAACFYNGYGKVCQACNGRHFYHCFFNKCTKGSFFLSFFMALEQYFRNCFFYPAKYIDGLIYVSNFTCSLHEKYMSGLRGINHMTLYNFTVGFDYYVKQNNAEKYYLFYGRLSKEKGLLTLFKAIKDLPDVHIKIAGSGPMEKTLVNLKREWKLDNVEFLGYKTGDALTALVRQAYFVIIPSECYENNPMTIVESYAVGTPVIGSEIGGIPEIIMDGKTGYSFSPANYMDLRDKIKQAHCMPYAAYRLFSQEAFSFAEEHFSKDRYYNKLVHFCNALLSNNENRCNRN